MLRFVASLLLVLSIFLAPATLPAPQPWSVGYWTPHGKQYLAPAKIEWTALTHVVHAWALVQPDASLDLSTQRVNSDGPELISSAHANGVKVLLGIGQPYWRGLSGNLGAAVRNNRVALVDKIMSIVVGYGFDGVDIDWEPFDSAADGEALRLLAADLRSRLGDRILTAAAVATDYAYWGTVEKYFDRISVMTYDLTGTYNPYSWHNAALYDTDSMVWSVDLAMKRFATSGVPGSKLSIGIPFFGYRWLGEGVTGPRQTWTTPPTVTQIPYRDIAGLIAASNSHWDSSAAVPFLSLDSEGTSKDQFITYDDARSIKQKIDYVKGKRLGGWIIWELSGDYFPEGTPKQPLLDAIKNTK
jgi:chitinase